MTHYRPVEAWIDLVALRNNLEVVRQCAPTSKLMAVIKADGYGHGVLRVAKQLSGADAFAVASIDEAVLLRQNGFLHRIILLEGLFSFEELELAIAHRLEMVVHSFHQIEWLASLGASAQVNVWLKFDTGMHRLGFLPSQVDDVKQSLNSLRCQLQLQLMSHLACADTSEDETQQQQRCFEDIRRSFPFSCSLANSAAVQRFGFTHYEWVRPGIMLYGAGKVDVTAESLMPVMTLASSITSLKWIEVGETVGYGNRWQAKRRTLLAVVAVGYGDGYPRHAPDGTPVLIQGTRCPLAGRVSMDMITVDVTDIQDTVTLGERAVLWGNGLSVDEVAEWSGTIGYELLCQITPRVPRIELKQGIQRHGH